MSEATEDQDALALLLDEIICECRKWERYYQERGDDNSAAYWRGRARHFRQVAGEEGA